MHVVIISAVYPPEPMVSARMAWDLSHYLADSGHKVTVVCPQPSRPIHSDYVQYRNPHAPIIINEDNVKIVRLPTFASPESRLVKRMWESFSFGREVTKYLAAEKEKPDVIYVNSWPLFAQALIAYFTIMHDIPMVLQIMDVYPEALTIRFPMIFRTIINFPLKKLDAWITRASTFLVVISENMRRLYIESRNIPAERIITISTWQDETIFENIPTRSDCCRMYGIQDNLFTFLFLGNIGPVAGVDFLIRAFAEAEISDSQLIIVGDGASKSDCVALVHRLNLSNVFFISDPDVSNGPILQNMAHVCMLPMKRMAGLSSVPSKLPSYMFSAKPVIATVDGESDTARFVTEAECGWVGEAENLTWLVNTMKMVAQLTQDRLVTCGENAKRFGLTHFSKSSGVNRMAETILQVCRKQWV